MSAVPASPLTPDHLAQIKNALDAITQAKYQIDLAKRAGIDVTQLEQIVLDNETKLRQVKQVYFPGQ